MLFHTPEFLFAFLPIVLLGYFLLARWSGVVPFAWLALSSLFFYGVWDYGYLPLILASIASNFTLGSGIVRLQASGEMRRAKALAAFGIAANVGALVYYKYLAFLAGEMNWMFGLQLTVPNIVLPIGISFYTFTQIAFLVDASRGKVKEKSFLNYLLFVTYFPHLVAGPILHHSEMMPQFADRKNTRFDRRNLAAGITFLSMGLFKKIFVADGLAPSASHFFDGLAVGGGITTYEAWHAALAYTLQLYFDFSGYSDMAVGLSLMFNVNLPVNFYSPYRSTSIIDFWRRWHMTLSRFLRDYIYIPLGGSRHGAGRRYVNLMSTMLIGGIWHGASTTFVVWGALHGAFLTINHGWRALLKTFPLRVQALLSSRACIPFYWLATFVAVVFGWVVFRAPTVETAWTIWGAMVQLGTLAIPPNASGEIAWIGMLVLWVAIGPNTNELMGYRYGTEEMDSPHPFAFRWQPTKAWALLIATMLMLTMVIAMTQREKLEFLYFQF